MICLPFFSLILGGGDLPVKADIDDLRIYGDCLDEVDIGAIYGNGGGDFNRLLLIGAGQTRIVANQRGNLDFEMALPVDNYLL